MRSFVMVAALGLAMARGPVVRADDTPMLAADNVPAKPISPLRRALAVGAALVPGVVARGSGSLVVHEPRAARRLAVTAGIGLGAAVLAAIPIGLTYGSDRVVFLVPMLVAGVGTMFASWFGDVFVALGAGRPLTPRALPRWHVGVAPWLVRDPNTGTRGYALVEAGAEVGPVWVAPSLLTSVEHDEQRGRVDTSIALRGARRGQVTGDHTALALRLAGQVHHNVVPTVTTITGELALHGRLDGVRLDPALAGSFGEVDAGYGFEIDRFHPGGTDVTDLVIARVAGGVYLRGGGELAVFYDHRRDTLAGGLVADRAAGFFGSLGVTGSIALGRGWNLTTDVELGSAWVFGLGVRRTGGGT